MWYLLIVILTIAVLLSYIKQSWKPFILIGRPLTGYIYRNKKLEVDPFYQSAVIDILFKYHVQKEDPGFIALLTRNYRGRKHPEFRKFEKRRILRIIKNTHLYMGFVRIEDRNGGRYERAHFIDTPVVNKSFLRKTNLSEKDIEAFEKSLIESGYPPLLSGQAPKASLRKHDKRETIPKKMSAKGLDLFEDVKRFPRTTTTNAR